MRTLIRRLIGRLPGVRSLHRLQRLSSKLEQCYRNQGLLAARCAGVPQIDPALTDADDRLGSSCALCRERDFQLPSYHRWCHALGEAPRYHRKQWEFVAIAAAFERAGLLREGARVLGFGVGREPLPALFAARGMTVVATDQAEETARAQGWVGTQQHAAGLSALSRPQVIADARMRERITYSAVDMNALPSDLGGFDALWSACSIEHLGSIEKTVTFVLNAMRCLRPGGIAVHTTEFNLDSNDDTVDQGPTVLLRQRDLDDLRQRLASAGHALAAMDLTQGDGFLDRYVDIPPYNLDAHLRLLLEQYCSTSVVLIMTNRGNLTELQIQAPMEAVAR